MPHTTSDWPRRQSPAAKTPSRAGGVLAVLCFEVAARVALEAELLGERVLRTEKAHREKDEIGFEDLLRARHFAHLPLPVRILHPFDAHGFYAGDLAVAVIEESLAQDAELARVLPELGRGLLVAVVDPENQRPLRPRVVVRALRGGFGRSSKLTNEAQPWRIEVPMQSVPVSPPPMTITRLPFALM